MTQEFICPYCDEHFDYEDFFEENPEEEAIDVVCDNCGKTMECTWWQNIEVRCDIKEG